ncbi:MAG: ribosome small subunit-dependent GTPase A [Proteobacteria bacterium]|nr:ribosome small subunit-dependent GTPase A [Pseudomonadota bacterium]MDA1301483.1 ribosome small subunit-dependent GTPase A [Pseudomonadota bacterium]
MEPHIQLGWTEFFADQLTDQDSKHFPARVFRQEVNRYHLMSQPVTGEAEFIAVLPGRLRDALPSERPTVGDWVMLSETEGQAPHRIERVLARKSRFSRKAPGDETVEQVVAANIDTVFIVAGLDGNFNPQRIERYVLLSWDSGAAPVIVLNKADIVDDLPAKLAQTEAVAMGVPILPVSAETGQGMDQLRQYLGVGKTGAFLGSSGVGKSSLTNRLLGGNYLATQEVRSDSKGRHTTTRREMCLIPGLGLVIDTPGMRELQLWADEETVASTFSDVDELVGQCRFRDCRHDQEPGCALKAAVGKRVLSQARVDSYLKYLRELAHLRERQDVLAQVTAKNERKRFARDLRRNPRKPGR